MAVRPRIYIDINDMFDDGYCMVVRFMGRPLSDVAEQLGLYEGMPVVLYYRDACETFEFDGVITYDADAPDPWKARADDSTFRRLREWSR